MKFNANFSVYCHQSSITMKFNAYLSVYVYVCVCECVYVREGVNDLSQWNSTHISLQKINTILELTH